MSDLSPSLRTFNVCLRLLPLAAKMALTFYIGRFLPLDGVGAYGMIFGLVMVLIQVIGLGMGYIVSREIVGASEEETLCKLRDQVILSLLTFAPIVGIACLLPQGSVVNDAGQMIFYALILGLGESLGNQSYNNLVSSGHPIRATVTFSIRSAFWIFPAIGLGLLSPRFQTVETVLNFWVAGVYLSLVAAFATWPGLPWSKLLSTPIRWGWMYVCSRDTLLLWLGAVGITAGAYIDRFVAMRYIGADYVGVVTFYFSFANALLALIQSGVFSFALPRLVTLHRESDDLGFAQETRRITRDVVVYGGAMAIGIGIGVAVLVRFVGRPLLVAGLPTFALMMLGAWIRANADKFYYVLFARHQDRVVWLGNLLYLIPALGLNLLLVPFLGLIGVGASSVIAATCLWTWRATLAGKWRTPKASIVPTIQRSDRGVSDQRVAATGT